MKVNFRRRLLGSGHGARRSTNGSGRSRGGSLFSRGLPAQRAEVLADFIGNIVINGARMRALVRYPDLREVVQDRPTFHFQFARQIVNPNLAHFTPSSVAGLDSGR